MSSPSYMYRQKVDAKEDGLRGGWKTDSEAKKGPVRSAGRAGRGERLALQSSVCFFARIYTRSPTQAHKRTDHGSLTLSDYRPQIFAEAVVHVYMYMYTAGEGREPRRLDWRVRESNRLNRTAEVQTRECIHVPMYAVHMYSWLRRVLMCAGNRHPESTVRPSVRPSIHPLHCSVLYCGARAAPANYMP